MGTKAILLSACVLILSGACLVQAEESKATAATQPTVAIRPVAATTQPATSSQPAGNEFLTVADFNRIKNYVLAHGDRETYCQMYNNNPHAALGGVDIYLHPDTGQQNINCDPKLSGFNHVVIRTQKMTYYRIALDQARSTLDCPIPEDGNKNDLHKCIKSVLADLDKNAEKPTSTKAAQTR
jgi:hypothetical protein